MSTLTGSFPGAGTVGCLLGNIQPAVFMGGAFTAFNVFYQGAPLTPQLAVTNVGFLYAYGALQCPMEALTGRKSWTHNALAGGVLGYAAYQHGVIGIPFNLGHACHARRIPLPAGAALVYGSMGAVLAMVAGKPL
mmetsp:Transcript_98/g.220  ORF Transcript_98/g.220 Transcript_98/m.220 type:complete len:135 (+) Transcript_98:24-428(+)|eukprot:CAMPEP_0119074684 /NCGR_PEP_ID=MMETSP1178-20130426/72404_1 /TAXON_ID=33656 /ORGANISM="unid sp, Strain CCMP2000" /LENGTH=134 /DNA_ID=CAMNT_0007056853 /DNA_START=24 /DNA_END=428 /DNA_ORIENTATION=-